MAITRLGTETSATFTTSASTKTLANTLSAGSNRVAWCMVGIEDADNISSATFGGVAATATAAQAKYSAGDTKIRMFYVLEADLPANGSKNWVVTLSGAATNAVMGAGTLQGVYQGAPEATSSGEGSDEVTVNITTLTNGAWILSCANSINGGTATYSSFGTGQSAFFNLNSGGAQVSVAGTYEEKATSGADAQYFSRASAVQMIGIAAAFKPADTASAQVIWFS